MKNFFGILFFILSLIFVRPIFAGNDITITCNQGSSECIKSTNLPLFSETNIYPGQTFSQNFFVNNNRNSGCNLTLKAVSKNEGLDFLSQKIIINITGTNNSNDLNISNYSLSDLLNSSKPNLSLGRVNKGKKNNYLWKVTLDSNADNTYQNLTSNFDINFNFECDDEEITEKIPSPVTTPPGVILGSFNDSPPSISTNSECTKSAPLAPTGFYVTDNNGSATLYWNKTISEHTGYLIAFGTSPGTYQYGAPDIGKDVYYTVGSLTPGAQYCFYVRSLNDCMPGERTPEYCINSGSNITAVDIIPAGFRTGVLGVDTENEILPENTKEALIIKSNQTTGKILGEADSTCTKQFLPLFFLLAFAINIFLLKRFSSRWFILLLISTIAFILDYLLSKNSCCYGIILLCRYFWIGNILSLLLPILLKKEIKGKIQL